MCKISPACNFMGAKIRPPFPSNNCKAACRMPHAALACQLEAKIHYECRAVLYPLGCMEASGSCPPLKPHRRTF